MLNAGREIAWNTKGTAVETVPTEDDQNVVGVWRLIKSWVEGQEHTTIIRSKNTLNLTISHGGYTATKTVIKRAICFCLLGNCDERIQFYSLPTTPPTRDQVVLKWKLKMKLIFYRFAITWEVTALPFANRKRAEAPFSPNLHFAEANLGWEGWFI